MKLDVHPDSSSIIAAMNWGDEQGVKFFTERVSGPLSEDVLVAAVHSKKKVIQYLVSKGAPVSQEAVIACIETGHPLNVVQFLTEEFLKSKNPEERQTSLNLFLKKAILSKASQEVMDFFFAKGAKPGSVSREEVLEKIGDRPKKKALVFLVNGFEKTVSKDDFQEGLDSFLHKAVEVNASEEDIHFYTGRGARVSSATVELSVGRYPMGLVFSLMRDSLKDGEKVDCDTLLHLAIKAGCSKDDLMQLQALGAQPTEDTLNHALSMLVHTRDNTSTLCEVMDLFIKKGVTPSQQSFNIAVSKGYPFAYLQGWIKGDVKPTEEMLARELSKREPDVSALQFCIKAGLKVTIDMIA